MAYGTIKVDKITCDDGGSDDDVNVSDLLNVPKLGGVTAGTVSASKAVIVDANKDITGFNDVTVTGDITGNLTGNVTGNVTGSVTGSVTGNASTATEATNVTAVANNSTDETTYPTFVGGATGTQGIETDTGLTYNPSSGILTTTQVTGNLLGDVTGDVTGDVSGTAATVTSAAQTAITSVGTLTGITIDGPYKQTHVAITQSATPTVDLSLGNYFTLTQNANVTSWTFNNPPGNTFSFSFVVELANAGFTTAWSLASGTVKWPADTAPTLTASKTHLIIFATDDGGTTYRASSIVDYTT